jgi:drug/metabolite transporter (DMT)-like permease
MLLITRPDTAALDLTGVVMMILSATLYATCSLIIKRLARHDPPRTIVFYMFLFTALFSLPLALFGADMRAAAEHLPMLLLLGALGFVIQYAVTQAFTLAPLNVVIPYSFISLVFVSVSGYVLFAEVPRPSTFAGAGVILMAVCYAAWREAKRSGLIKNE